MDTIPSDAALAAALLILELFDGSPGATKPELLSQVSFICLEAIREADRRRRQSFEPSAN